MRLIDADKLKAHYSWWKNATREMTMGEAKDIFDDIVDLQPTIDPVRHGHWVGVDDEPCNVWECDVCGWIYEDDEPYYNFCPHCGAKMDVPDMDVGKKEDEDFEMDETCI